jgi:hypothetical protein
MDVSYRDAHDGTGGEILGERIERGLDVREKEGALSALEW